jgi:hypothetical protein
MARQALAPRYIAANPATNGSSSNRSVAAAGLRLTMGWSRGSGMMKRTERSEIRPEGSGERKIRERVDTYLALSYAFEHTVTEKIMSNRIITIALSPDVTNVEAIEEIANSFYLNRYVESVTIGEPSGDFLEESDRNFKFRRLMLDLVSALFPTSFDSEEVKAFRRAIFTAHAVFRQK